MAADLWKFYESFGERLGDGGHDLDNDTYYLALFLVTSNCATETWDALANLDNQHANANGYVTGGQALDNVTWVESGGVTTFDCDPEVFTASGGSIVCRFGVVYNWTHASDLLVCYSLLDNAPADVTATDTNTLTCTPHASGIFTLTG